ncbi:MAG: STAS/SEC14 domain-containing protein [bacterium]|nr:STAS/SEC14 domain-containing protein [bacterium]
MQTHIKTPGLSKVESELLLKINQGIPTDIQKRYDVLIAKRQAEELSRDEYSELLQLSDQIEKQDATRIECLTELAIIRQIPFPELLEELHIQAPAHG